MIDGATAVFTACVFIYFGSKLMVHVFLIEWHKPIADVIETVLSFALFVMGVALMLYGLAII